MVDHTVQLFNCPGCGTEPGELHGDGCDHAHCPNTGRQRLMCDHDGECESMWSGGFVGEAECREWGWWVVLDSGIGFVPCPAGTEGALPDTNRLLDHARWDPGAQRYIRTDDTKPRTA